MLSRDRCEVSSADYGTSRVAQFHLNAWIVGLALMLSGMNPVFAQGAEKERDGAVLTVSTALCNSMKRHNVFSASAPVPCERLRLLKFSYTGFDAQSHDDGEMIVMDAVARNVSRIFAELHERKFPITKAKLIDQYEGDDEASMSDNNTSAFNVREIAGGGPQSIHAYGLAIDLNPIQNPYVKRSGETVLISPKSGTDYLDRGNIRPGMAETVVDVFAHHGFAWGGDWRNPIDYQHFQVSRKLANQLTRVNSADALTLFARYVERGQACLRTSLGGSDARKYCMVVVVDQLLDSTALAE
jgi:hypothetical protein